MKNLIQETVKQLKSGNVHPLPKWKFVLKSLLTWFLAGIIGFFSAVGLAVILFLVTQFDWNVYEKIGNRIFFGFIFFPYFWMIIVLLFIFGIYEVVRRTKSGYKYSWKKIVLIVLGVSLGMGILAHLANFGEVTNNAARRNFPMYRNFVHTMEDQWSQPEKGFLAGEIVSKNNNSIFLEDFDGKKWEIILDKNTIVMPMAKIEEEAGVKIIGKIISEGKFLARQIRPWRGNMLQRKFEKNNFTGEMRMRNKNNFENKLPNITL
ncbi:MAG: hypothetical protein ACD_11C00026G0008 [uncultured bacterium]|nr:MAG: hypothetical protein ACD_11C00026G0008 [uncultured bacterium]HBR72052.1 hypothetical protein [Candidatus Moranbacteria bacterium]